MLPNTERACFMYPDALFADDLILFCRSDVSAKDAGNADFKLSVDYLISRILSDEELFGSGMR